MTFFPKKTAQTFFKITTQMYFTHVCPNLRWPFGFAMNIYLAHLWMNNFILLRRPTTVGPVHESPLLSNFSLFIPQIRVVYRFISVWSLGYEWEMKNIWGGGVRLCVQTGKSHMNADELPATTTEVMTAVWELVHGGMMDQLFCCWRITPIRL